MTLVNPIHRTLLKISSARVNLRSRIPWFYLGSHRLNVKIFSRRQDISTFIWGMLEVNWEQLLSLMLCARSSDPHKNENNQLFVEIKVLSVYWIWIFLPQLSGRLCERLNACDPNPCEYSGVCRTDGNNFKCDCLPSLRGRTCTEDVNECLERPVLCHNGGTCQNLHGSYR